MPWPPGREEQLGPEPFDSSTRVRWRSRPHPRDPVRRLSHPVCGSYPTGSLRCSHTHGPGNSGEPELAFPFPGPVSPSQSGPGVDPE